MKESLLVIKIVKCDIFHNPLFFSI